MQQSSNHYDERANEGRDGVKLGAQDSGDFSYENVTGHSTADSGQHAQQCRCNGPCMKRERLPRTSYRKKSQSRGIEHQHRAAQAINGSKPPECYEPGKYADSHISPIVHRGRRNRANHYVARDAASGPLSANTNVPPRSKTTSRVFTTICSLTIN